MQILTFLSSIADGIIPLFELDFKAAKKQAGQIKNSEELKDYVQHVILHLIKKK